MALDFPASPTDGQVYQTVGLTFIWNAGTSKWKAINGPQYKKAVCVATRNTGTETLSSGANYPILGAYTYNYQSLYGYNAGGVVVPYTGLYRVDMEIYNQNVLAASGRLGLTINAAAAQAVFYQFPNGSPGASTLYKSSLLQLNANDHLMYRVEQNSVHIHSASGHTQIMVEYMGDA